MVLHDAPESLKGVRNIFINGPKAVKLGVNRLGPLFSHETTSCMMVANPLLHMAFKQMHFHTPANSLKVVIKSGEEVPDSFTYVTKTHQ